MNSAVSLKKNAESTAAHKAGVRHRLGSCKFRRLGREKDKIVQWIILLTSIANIKYLEEKAKRLK